MLELYLNVQVKEMTPDVERVLRKYNLTVMRGMEPIRMYFCAVKIKKGPPEEVMKNYRKIISDLSNESCVTRVERSEDVRILNA